MAGKFSSGDPIRVTSKKRPAKATPVAEVSPIAADPATKIVTVRLPSPPATLDESLDRVNTVAKAMHAAFLRDDNDFPHGAVVPYCAAKQEYEQAEADLQKLDAGMPDRWIGPTFYREFISLGDLIEYIDGELKCIPIAEMFGTFHSDNAVAAIRNVFYVLDDLGIENQPPRPATPTSGHEAEIALAELRAWADRIAEKTACDISETHSCTKGEDRRPCFDRDHTWLEWYETEGEATFHSHAKIRDKHNETLPPGDHVTRDVVMSGIRLAKKER